MFHCDVRFQRYTRAIQRVWDGRFNDTIGNWQSFGWWAAVVVLFGFLTIFPIMTVSNSLHPFPYLREVYCPRVGDCIPFLRPEWPLPAWYWFHLLLALVGLFAGLMTQWGYRRRRWCLAWWVYLIYLFSITFILASIFEGVLFVGLQGSPMPTALVGYGVPVIYTLWFTATLLSLVHPLWRGERLDFRPPPLKLQAGAGGAAASLGILGVALGRLLNEMPHGNWGYLIFGVIGVPWMMHLSIRGGMQSLFVLAPWRIVMEAEAGMAVLEEEE